MTIVHQSTPTTNSNGSLLSMITSALSIVYTEITQKNKIYPANPPEMGKSIKYELFKNSAYSMTVDHTIIKQMKWCILHNSDEHFTDMLQTFSA